jgi:predicted dehydrogenase
MKSEPLKLGFIGGALDSAIGATHKIAARMDGRWSLASGCFSPDRELNSHTAESWGVPLDRLYPSWEKLLIAEKERLDAVVVLTPTPLHAEIVISALEQGYPVICEKALAISSAEAKRIKETVEKCGGFLAVTYNYTGYPMLRELQRLVHKGCLGKLNQIHIEMPQEGFARLGKNQSKPAPQAWRLKDHDISTLSLDLGVHIHNLVSFLSDERPIEVISANNTFGFFEDIVDNTLCIAKYTGNLDCQIWFGKTALGHSNGLRVRLYGTEGSAEWFQMRPETMELSDNLGGKKTLERSAADIEIADEPRYNRFKAGHPAGFIEAFANYYYDLADSLIEFKSKGSHSSPWVFGVDMAEEGLLMLEALARSAKSKAWQSVCD